MQHQIIIEDISMLYYSIILHLLLFAFHDVHSTMDTYTFALLSDIHIGDTGANALGRARSAVAKINQLAANRSTNLEAVFITGDLTNSAMPSQYDTVRNVLNNLTVPFYPIIGNHDQWLYNSTWEDIAPVGDQLFARSFADILHHRNIINYPNGTVWNPTHACQSWFQNYRLKIHNNVSI
jgi:predicted MPP superfamily phosphohydrolase